MTYRAPVREIAFALQAAGHSQLMARAFPDLDEATAAAVLEAAGGFAADVLAPLNRIGDREGARYANGAVTAAPGFAQAYRDYAAGGWTSLSADPAHGGQGLPKALDLAVFEMMNSANMAFSLCPMLSQAAVEALTLHGTERQKALVLPRLVSGEWTGAMALTEPQAGSDLAAVAARARPDGQGGYRLDGQKIFITWGDHDMAENICHLVLGRLPDASPGVKGISLFLAPKRLIGDDGRAGAANGLRPASIEHKLGIHGSPTCVMLYDDAQAELVGEPGQGLAHMFAMMNAARLQVGVEGVGIAEGAFQHALAYAQERRQGRAAWPTAAPATIYGHPDVRRTLMLMKAKTAAARGICLTTGVLADLARLAPTAEEREAARARQELLTPIAKAWSTDVGVEVASLGVQVHGGMGYIEETGAAQYLRDARIAPIYEGTNGIQAIDLAGRKLDLTRGEALRALAAEMRATAEALTENPDLQPAGSRLAEGVAALEQATDWLLAHRGPDSLAGATPYLKLAGDVIGGWMLGREALLSGGGAEPWLAAKGPLARLYASQVLAQAPGLAAGVMAGGGDLEAVSAEALAG
jgi:alkylation response protein AidB-like acyl-CoA dehydrogenase